MLNKSRTVITQPWAFDTADTAATLTRDEDIKQFDSIDPIYDMDDDPIAISVLCSEPSRREEHFHWEGAPQPFRATYEPALAKTDPALTDEHRSKAQTIRAYYRDKLMIAGLGNLKMSQFRKDLWAFLERDDNSYKASELGIVKTLPVFYAEDKFLEKIRAEYNNTPRTKPRQNLDGKQYVTLTHIGNFEKRTKLGFAHLRNCTSYWYHDEDDRLFNIILERKNPFMDVWHNMLAYPIDVSGAIRENHRTIIDLHYCDFSSWKLEI